MEYKAIAWLQDASDFNVEDCVQRLKKRFPDAEISSTKIRRLRQQRPEVIDVINMAMKNFTVELYFNQEPYVALQAQEFATRVPDYPRVSELVQCRKGILVICREEGSIMEYFNDYIFVLETLESFTGVLAFDLASLA